MSNSEKPWLKNKQWRRGAIHTKSKFITISLVILSFIWNGVAHRVEYSGEFASYIEWSVKGIGYLIVLATIIQIVKWFKFGESVFRMAAVPGVVGGKLVGLVETNATVRPSDGFKVTLYSVKRTTSSSGSGENRSTRTHEEMLRTETHTIQDKLLRSKSSRYAVPVCFKIPNNARSTSSSRSGSSTVKIF